MPESKLMSAASPGRVANREDRLDLKTFDLFGSRVQVGGTAPAASMLAGVLGGFGPITVDAGTAESLPRYEVIQQPDEWQVNHDGSVIFVSRDLGSAVDALETRLITDAVNRRDDVFHLHGASLCAPGKRAGIVLIAES